MAQHDQNIANQTFPEFRGDLNAALAAAFSSSAGASEPATKLAGQLWFDTANEILYIRHTSNNRWVRLFGFGGGEAVTVGRVSAVNGSANWPAYTFEGDSNTGMYRISADRAALAAGATAVLEWTPAVVRALIAFSCAGTIATDFQFRASATGDSAERPGFSWSGDVNTGMYQAGDGAIGFATDAVRKLLISADTVQTDVPFIVPQGTAGAPGLAFKFRETTGLIIDASNRLAVVVNGNVIATFDAARMNGQVAGDGSLLTNLSAAEVGTAIAALGIGDVGAFVFARRKTSGGSIFHGDVVAGSAITASNSEGQQAGSPVALGGSWQCLGVTDGTNATLFRRV